MKTVLVTGASGFIGRHCLPLLKEKGFKVVAISRHPFNDNTIEWKEWDFEKNQNPNQLIDQIKPTHLLHLAWFVEHPAFWTSSKNKPWEKISSDLFTAFANAGGQKAVATGTCAEYAWSDSPLNESNSPLEPSTPYGESKKIVFSNWSETSAKTKVPFYWARLFGLYGPHEPEGRFIPSILIDVLKNKPAICRNGTNKRDFLFVDDVAEALVSLLDGSGEGPINLASGTATPLGELATLLAKEINPNAKVNISNSAPSPSNPDIIAADTAKLRNFGWSPQNSLKQGLQKTIKWWRENLTKTQSGASH